MTNTGTLTSTLELRRSAAVEFEFCMVATLSRDLRASGAVIGRVSFRPTLSPIPREVLTRKSQLGMVNRATRKSSLVTELSIFSDYRLLGQVADPVGRGWQSV